MFFDKSLRMSGISGIQNALAFFEQSGRLAMSCRDWHAESIDPARSPA